MKSTQSCAVPQSYDSQISKRSSTFKQTPLHTVWELYSRRKEILPPHPWQNLKNQLLTPWHSSLPPSRQLSKTMTSMKENY